MSRAGTTPGSFRMMPRILIQGVKGLDGKEVVVTAARKQATWGVIPEGAASASAVDGEKLCVDPGMQPPILLVDVQVEGKEQADGKPVLGKADAFRVERGGWPVILPSGKPGSNVFLASPGSISAVGCSDFWSAPVKMSKVVRD